MYAFENKGRSRQSTEVEILGVFFFFLGDSWNLINDIWAF
jgi:hypothetical protein